MSAAWNEAMILALAPDPASAKAGQGLATARKWANLGSGEGLIWGECQGSGANPYQTKVEPDGPAFSCSCPSRKFPCKHSLALMLVWASAPTSFVQGTLPAWVASWKENREKKAEQAKTKAERGPAIADPAAAAKRDAARNAKVAAGLDDLSLWIADLARQGFASLGAKSGNLWEDQARRMIDAQAPGVARRLRQIDELSLVGEGWQSDLLDRLARLHLLAQGFRRLAQLPPGVAEDVRATIGFPTDLDTVRGGPGVRDRWQVVGQSVVTEDRLTVLRTWLIGRETGRPALVLDFAAGGKPLDMSLPPGVVLDGELAFFPGSAPLRALVKERVAVTPLESLSRGTTIDSAFTAYGSALAKNPWLELFPIVLDGVVLREDGGSWSVRDASGAAIPLSKHFQKGWQLIALEGGGTLTVCGEFDGATLNPLGAWAGGRFVALSATEPSSSPLSRSVPIPLFMEATTSALLGLDRRPPPSPEAEGPIGRALPGLEGTEPAARLLAVAAASSLYGRVGRKPAVDASPLPEGPPPEDRPECPPEAAARLRRMLTGDHAECLPEWVERLAAAGRRLPSDSIVDLLAWSENREVDSDAMRAALGARGRWLAAKQPRWRKLGGGDEAADPTRVWETGALHERLAVLRAMRAEDPRRARELVESTFASDPADRRAAFVAELARGLSMDDEPFLEAALDDRGKDVRKQAAVLLRALPESRLCQRMIERARGVLTWKGGTSAVDPAKSRLGQRMIDRARGVLGLDGGTLVVEPPTSCDKETVRDGVELKPPTYVKIGERAWWLREIVSSVPTNAIAAFLGKGSAEIVAANRDGQWEAVLWTALATSAVRHADPDWAEALLDSRPAKASPLSTPGQDHQLLKALPEGRREAFLLRRLEADPGPLRSSHPAFGFIRSLDAPVGPTVAAEVLRRVRPILEDERERFADAARASALRMWSGRGYDPKYHDHEVISMIGGLADVLPFDLADEAGEGVVGDEEGQRVAYADAYATMIDRLRFRRDMHGELAS